MISNSNIPNTESPEDKAKRLEQDKQNEQASINKQHQNLQEALDKIRNRK